MSTKVIEFITSIGRLDLRLEDSPPSSPILGLRNLSCIRDPLFEIFVLPGERGRSFSQEVLAKGALNDLREVIAALAAKSPRGDGLRETLLKRAGIDAGTKTSFYYSRVTNRGEAANEVVSIVYGDKSSVECLICFGYLEHGIHVQDD